MSASARVPTPKNEPVRAYAPGSAERTSVKAALRALAAEVTDIPMTIGGESIRTADHLSVQVPHAHARVVGRAHRGTQAHVGQAISAALSAKREWANLAWSDRAAVFLKAADLLAGPFRDRMNAATMLGQSKTIHQAEIDAVCELADFWRFNAHYYRALMEDQPYSPDGQWNQVELRPLDGFVFAVSPFNFTSIAANLPTAPALLGNVAVWKPAETQLLSARVIVEVLEAAGLPPGVVNLVSGEASELGQAALSSPDLGGIHFTGSTATFHKLWKAVGNNLGNYRQYPRLVGETGGKDFIFAHPSADLDALAVAIVRGGFEYQGQKCSAASRIYVPASLWPRLRERTVGLIGELKVGDVADFSNFMGAVIDQRAFERIDGYYQLAKKECRVLTQGAPDGKSGWFVPPTLVESPSPDHRLMKEEIFGPIVTAWVYPDASIDEAVEQVDSATPYGLTGAIFAQDRRAIAQLSQQLSSAAGNFYINDKPTGAVVGQQPFGGSRASGTNDKAGSAWNLMRWASPRAIKETFVPARDWRYPFLGEP